MQNLSTKLGILLVLMLFNTNLFAQYSNGLKGVVKDQVTESEIPGVSIQLIGATTRYTSSQENGTFEVGNLPKGKYQLKLIVLGYEEFVSDSLTIHDDEIITTEIFLNPVGLNLETVQVQGRANRESELSLLIERQKASSIVQKMGSQELDRKGLGNVEAGVTQIVGITQTEDQGIFVRGLGDRYNNATLNGLPIPSPDPDVKMIPMDIFPSNIVKNIEILKSYNSAYYGDFSGGNIDILTKDFPDKTFLKLGLSVGANSRSTGKDFLGTQNGISDYLGFSRNKRSMPSWIESLPVYDSYNENNQAPGFHTPWVPSSYKAPINSGISLSFGDNFVLNSNEQLGYLFSLSSKQSYSIEPGKSAWFNAQQESIYDYNTQAYQYKTNTTGLLNINYRPNYKTKIGLLGLFVNDSEDGIIDNYGLNWDLGEIYGRRNTYIQNTLFTTQLFGSHEINAQNSVELAFGYTHTIGSIPDRAQWMAESRGNGLYQFSSNGITDVNRYFSDLNDDDFSFHSEWTSDLSEKDQILKNFKVGFDARIKGRQFNARQIDADARNIRTLFAIHELDQILSENNLGIGNSSTWRYKEVPNEQNKYRSEMEIFAPYIQANLEFNSKWALDLGLRFEQSRQSTDYKLSRDIISAPYRNNTFNGSDFLPSLSLKHLLNSKSNILFAVSRTIARPLFTEVAPFRYNESAGTAQRQGNPNLENGAIYNVDLRYDYFPNPGELISVALFAKQLYNPIELVRLSGSEPMFSYVNSDEAQIAGIEFELNKKINKQLSVGLNATYQHSEIKFDEDKLSEKGVPFYPTHFNRPLYGASPYSINADVSYLFDWNEISNTQLTLTYSRAGKRLFIAGSDGTGDIYEMPLNHLNATLNTQLNKRFGFDISLQNLLDSKWVFQQEFSQNNLEYMNIRKGISASLSLHYNF